MNNQSLYKTKPIAQISNQTLKDHYQDLFSQKSIVQMTITHLEPNHKKNSTISLNELEQTVKWLKNNNAPGDNNITTEVIIYGERKLKTFR